MQLLPGPPEHLMDLFTRWTHKAIASRTTFNRTTLPLSFASVYCDIVPHKERASNSSSRGVLGAFQIHSALRHRQGLLLPVEGNAPLYAQLYIYHSSHAVQKRSERKDNLDHEIIRNLSAILTHCSLFARIYHLMYEILSNHESSGINSEDRFNNNDSTESRSPYIILGPSIRMRLIEAGDIAHTTCQQ